VIVSALLLRKMIGAGTPRALRDLVERVFFLLFWLISVTRAISVPLPSFRGSHLPRMSNRGRCGHRKTRLLGNCRFRHGLLAQAGSENPLKTTSVNH
jgi:hypothetical protein